MKVKFLLIVFLLSINLIHPAVGGKIDAELQKKIDSAPVGSTWDIIIQFKVDPKLLTPPPPTTNPEESHLSAYNAMLKLKKHAEESQSTVISEIKSFTAARASSGSKDVQVKSRWCTKTASVYSASKDLIDLLGTGKPEHENITMIVEDVAFKRGKGEKRGKTVSCPPEESQNLLDMAWGLKKIEAKRWWDAGFDGSGVIIGHIDDGVDINHPSLKFNWVGKGDGWRAVRDLNSTFPYEGNPGSHGTHTLGTIIGRGSRKKGTTGNLTEDQVNFYGVGVAPGARWISCSDCDPNKLDGNGVPICPLGGTADCLEFMYCPNDKNKCKYRPSVVSLSSGCNQDETQRCIAPIMDPCIKLLKSHRVIMVYAAGNEGEKGCQTLDDPSDHEDVIGVGNVDQQDVLAAGSSMGPPKWRYNDTEIDDRAIFKPDLVAPGEQIISTTNSGPEGKFNYEYMSGTSMASPHVTGVIALLLSRTRDLTLADVRSILADSAVNNTQLKSTNPRLQCGQKPDYFLQNHKFGFGRLRLPDLNSDLMKTVYTVKRPTREMPPPPTFTAAAPRSVLLRGIVGVATMALIAF